MSGRSSTDHNVSSATFYKWKAQFAGMTGAELKEKRTLEQEGERLKRLLADRLEGRNAAQLARFTNDAFLSEWAIGIRYAPNAEVLEGQAREKRYERWKRDADTAIQAMQEVA